MSESQLPAPAPLRRFAGLAFVCLITLAGVLLAWQFSSVLILFAAALVLAATIAPVINALTRVHIPRTVGAIVMVLLVVAALLAILTASGYVLAEELPQAASRVQMDYTQLRTKLAARSGWQGSLGAQLPPAQGFEDLVARTQLAPVAPANAPAGSASVTVTQPVVAVPAVAPDAALSKSTLTERRASGLLRLLVGTTTNVAGVMTQLLVLIFLSLYWSLERDWFERLWLSLLPPAGRRNARAIWRELETGVGAYVRSEVVQSVVVFCLMYVGLRLMGAEYTLLMAWTAALATLIPLVSWPVALVPVVTLGLLTSPLVALGGGIYLTLLLALMEFVVEPRIDTRRRAGSIVGLITALVMLQALGVVGLLVAGPVAVAIQILFSKWQAQPQVAAQAPATDAIEKLDARVAQLRAAMGQVETDIPLPTRSLYERLQMLIAKAEKSL